MIYFSLIPLSSIFMYIGEYFRKKYNKYSAFIWYLLGIMILVILASKRSIEVGSDTGLYRSFFMML